MFNRENKQQEKEIQAQIAARQQLYQRVFNTPDGDLVMKDLAKRCFVYYTTYNDVHAKMGFNEGRRSIYNMISDLLTKDLQQILEELTK